MRRYVLLILMLLVIMNLVNYRKAWLNAKRYEQITTRADSLSNIISLNYWEIEQLKRDITAMQLQMESMGTIDDSVWISHDKQIRWLQWHVDKLRNQ